MKKEGSNSKFCDFISRLGAFKKRFKITSNKRDQLSVFTVHISDSIGLHSRKGF